ncbi:MAG: crossover junction endodeoxyribonuclease RuvC [Rhodospirillaceae bacterium]|nr:crossover junction endodeoxyribonuclease RuvC [Rhodospirillaceae bacterium]MCY4311339.1 crossover junction endodeoxyribonuclease RuvC [Rhodospirillaceae bacterium]
MSTPFRILGLDPGLRRTGWGVIESCDHHLRHIASGVVSPDNRLEMPARLNLLYEGITSLVDAWSPDEAAVEEIFVSKNPLSTLRLGQARGVVLLAPARASLTVYEYAANVIKKSVVGAGHADKSQMQAMVRMLLPTADPQSIDAADALAVAICHAHHTATQRAWQHQKATAG